MDGRATRPKWVKPETSPTREHEEQPAGAGRGGDPDDGRPEQRQK